MQRASQPRRTKQWQSGWPNSRTQQREVLVFFFFSSRRRHTRFDCDWSSDVCSSDLHDHALLDFRLSLPEEWARDEHRRQACHVPEDVSYRTRPELCLEMLDLWRARSEEHTSELQSQSNLVCRLLLEKKNKKQHSLN